jgi:hypothetical protein
MKTCADLNYKFHAVSCVCSRDSCDSMEESLPNHQRLESGIQRSQTMDNATQSIPKILHQERVAQGSQTKVRLVLDYKSFTNQTSETSPLQFQAVSVGSNCLKFARQVSKCRRLG